MGNVTNTVTTTMNMVTKDFIKGIETVKNATKQLGKGVETTTQTMNKFNKEGQIIGSTMSKITKPISESTLRQQKMARIMEHTKALAGKYGMAIDNVTTGLRKQNLQVTSAGDIQSILTGKVVDTNKSMTKANGLTKRFQMHWLGIMFAGMAISRMFGGMVKSVLKLMGVMDVWGATITTVLLPVMLPLSDMLMKIMFFFMDLPEPVQKVIGGFILFGAVVGGLLMLVGQFALGWNSLITLLGTMGTTIGVAAGVVAAVIGGIILVIWGVIQVFRNWGKDWAAVSAGILKVIAGIALALAVFIGGPLLWIVAGVALAASLIIDHWDSIREWFIKIGTKIRDWWRNLFAKFPEPVQKAFTWLATAFKWFFWDNPKKWLTKLWDLFTSIFGKIGDFFKNIKGGGNWVGKLLGFQKGGIMPYDGLAYLHQGEKITPAGQTTNFASNVVVNANVSNDMDIRSLANSLSRYWVADFQRTNMQRGL